MPYHDPVLLDEAIEGLNIKPNGIYVDLTFGGGGHSRAILKKMNNGKLIGFDQDIDAQQNIPKDHRFELANHNFKYLRNFLHYYNVDKVDGILGDLGVSSHHFDEAERGFAFRLEGNLDMRMNQRIATTAADVLNTYPAEDLQQIFRQFGELKDSRRITKKIIEKRSFKPFHHTFDLTEALQMFAPGKSQNKFFAKIFQALRIEVNQELEVLKQMLIQSTEALNNGGRMVIISYHSLEDRIVKNFFKSGNFEGILNKDFYGNIIAPFKQVSRKVITPTEEEQERNPRSRSAKMRIAEKTEYHAG